jgi:hypothetical protein
MTRAGRRRATNTHGPFPDVALTAPYPISRRSSKLEGDRHPNGAWARATEVEVGARRETDVASLLPPDLHDLTPANRRDAHCCGRLRLGSFSFDTVDRRFGSRSFSSGCESLASKRLKPHRTSRNGISEAHHPRVSAEGACRPAGDASAIPMWSFAFRSMTEPWLAQRSIARGLDVVDRVSTRKDACRRSAA